MKRQLSCGSLGLVSAGLAAVLVFVGGCSSDTGKSGGGDKGGEAVRLNAGGSTFVYPIMSKWAAVYEKEAGDQINYQSIGSGGGIQKMTTQEFDFGCSDAPLNEEQTEKARSSGGEVVHVPLVMGAVVPIYNLEEVKEPLQFSGEVLADIFLRKITKWNDERIKKINPKAADQLPAKNIVVVHRSDGSGTTYVFADYLGKVSPEWKAKVGVSTSLKWGDDTTGAKGSEGVSGQVKNSAGAIGYVEMTFALQSKIRFAAMQNQEKEFVVADPASVSAAAANSLTKIPDDLRYSLTDAPGKGSYPISGTVWAIVYVDQPAGKGKHVVDFLRWVTREDKGQSYANDLHYAPLPKGLIKRIDDKLATIKVGK
jgi:phosphate ABC transporter phosphate-binding protein